MKLKQDKCDLLVSGYKNENVWGNRKNQKFWKGYEQKLLPLDIDINLNFKNKYLLCVEKVVMSHLL